MAAGLFALGRTTVPSNGTPVQPVLNSSVTGPLGAKGLQNVHSVLFQAIPTNTGKTYIGLSTMNKSTGAGVLATLAVPTANLIPSFAMSLTAGANAVPLGDIYIDADTNNEGVSISGVIA